MQKYTCVFILFSNSGISRACSISGKYNKMGSSSTSDGLGSRGWMNTLAFLSKIKAYDSLPCWKYVTSLNISSNVKSTQVTPLRTWEWSLVTWTGRQSDVNIPEIQTVYNSQRLMAIWHTVHINSYFPIWIHICVFPGPCEYHSETPDHPRVRPEWPKCWCGLQIKLRTGHPLLQVQRGIYVFGGHTTGVS